MASTYKGHKWWNTLYLTQDRSFSSVQRTNPTRVRLFQLKIISLYFYEFLSFNQFVRLNTTWLKMYLEILTYLRIYPRFEKWPNVVPNPYYLFLS